MNSATSFSTTSQQLNLTLGICLAAAALAGSLAVTGHVQPRLSDYSAAFIAVALISLAASPTCAPLQRNAGDELSGRAVPRRPGPRRRGQGCGGQDADR